MLERDLNVMNVKQILNLSSRDINKLSDQDLRKIVTIANSAANKRIKRAYSKGVTSDVIDRVLERGKFSVAGLKTRQELENALVSVSSFLKAKTSTIRGIKSEKTKMFKELARQVNLDLPESEKINVDDWQQNLEDTEIKRITDLVWTQVDKLSENKQFAITKRERYRLAARGFDVVTRSKRPVRTKKGLLKNLKNWYQAEYEKSIQENELNDLTSEEQKVAEIYGNFR